MTTRGGDRHPRLYFAYGLNMDLAGMRARCPQAAVVTTARLRRHRFLINTHGVATVVPQAASQVHGVLWRISHEDERSLDTFEGVVSRFYRKVNLTVQAGETTPTPALVYVAANDMPGSPRRGYLELVLAAARCHRLEPGYVSELRAWSKRDPRQGPLATHPG